MKIFSVGPDELESYELSYLPDNYLYFVYYYKNGYYDGDGYGILVDVDKKMYKAYLSHCSCYGPLDDWQKELEITRDELESDSVLYGNYEEEVIKKILELI